MAARIRNIVFACPGATWEEYQEKGRVLASFYAELLGMRLIRDDWFVIENTDGNLPRLAFGDGPGEYRPPTWPDPQRPQQMHLDLFVGDLDAAGRSVVALGATLLRTESDHRTYADPAGHPFCLYEGDRTRIGRVVIDCPDPPRLAAFYEELLGDTAEPTVTFQRSSGEPPRWPDPAYPQQVHLDLHADNLEATRELAERLGATPLPAMGGSAPVYADPAGHPFCLCTTGT